MRKIDLTQGSIGKGLYRMALPVMGSSFLQMAYNMVDMIWIGRVGSDAVAAVGSAGFYMWLAWGIILLSKTGAEVRVAQNVGAKNFEKAQSYSRSAIQFNIALALAYTIFLIVMRKSLIGFFNLGNLEVEKMAIEYLVIIAIGTVFSFLGPVLAGIFNGYGDSRTPFLFNAVGLVANIVLDPLLIFGYFGFPKLGVKGAAIATVLSQFVVITAFLIYMKKSKKATVRNIGIRKKANLKEIKEISLLGAPVAMHSMLFTGFSMVIARIIAAWGPLPIAVQKVGSQIEAISWMTSGGFQVALSTFVGQNYGAGKYERIKKGYKISMGIISIVGFFATFLLYFFAKEIFTVFIPQGDAVEMGVDYLRILSYSQWFMCIEIITQGAFNGLGKTAPPSIVGIVFNALRIPMALILSATALGLDGVWWTISITSMFKGIILVIWFIYFMKKNKIFHQ